MGLAMILSHGVLIWLARVHSVWDARHDGLWALVGLCVGVLAVWLHWDAIAGMAVATR